jgi:hypothetical protein
MKQKTKIAKIEQVEDGFFFPELGIHVAAETPEAAKEIVKLGYNIDVDNVPAHYPAL